MPGFSLILFDDAVARSWEPYALTRPAGELLLGTLTLRARAERVLGARCSLHLAADHLRDFAEDDSPPVASLDEPPAAGDRLFWLSRALPAWEVAGTIDPRLLREGPIRCGDETAGWYAPAGTPPPPPGFLDDPDSYDAPDATPLPGRVLRRVWELVSENAEQVALDVAALFPAGSPLPLPPHVHQWGDHPVILDDSVRVEPGVAFDTSDGPIWLDRGVVVRAFTRLCGPSYIGPGSKVLGGNIDCVSSGPVCKLRGEMSSTVVLGYSNKQHDGHLGHAYVGRWVNLGAETSNSDLKNNYSPIRLWTPAGEADTGEIKMGCLMGDHVKTGIGVLINTGTVIGAGSNLWGTAIPPRYVPPFSWGSGEALTEYRVDKFLEVCERAMARREVTLSEAARRQFAAAWERSRGVREPEAAGKG